ncbi:MAG: sigma 54-interacting transcriptional regulator [Vicinamibacterales bacterium]
MILEQADGGTVFLDEIGEMSLRLQGLLLRFLETGEVRRIGADTPERRIDVRVVAASNRVLEAEVERCAFREDLFYRLNVIRLHVPALRARLDDAPLLARHFIAHFSQQYRLGNVTLDDAVVEALVAYPWPGNVRELRNIVERTVVQLKGDSIRLADLPAELRRAGALASLALVDPPLPSPSMAAALLDRIVRGSESFWTVVYEPFMAHDLTRQHVRDLVQLGLAECGGDTRELGFLLRVGPSDSRRLMTFLRRYDCLQPPPSLSAASASGPYGTARSL